MHVQVGEAVPFAKLPATGDRRAFMRHLREMTYQLGEGVPPPSKPAVKRPRRAPEPARRPSSRRSAQ